MKTLPGQEVQHTDYAELLKAIDKLLWDMVYEPVVDLVRPSLPKSLRGQISPRELQESTARELHNAGEDALRKALKDGRVQMLPDPKGEEALFTVPAPDRHISDGLKSFGARINKTTGLWACPIDSVPSWVRLEASGYSTRSKAVHDTVTDLIDELEGKIDELVARANLAKSSDDTIGKVQKGAWKEGAKKLEASWNLGPAGQTALAKAFERSRGIRISSPSSKVSVVSAFDESAKREVKVWALEALARLRAEVEANAEQGYRAEGLAERIRNEYGVSKTRAELIARQETSNFMANYREARALDAGIKKYQWYTVRDSRTRKDHLALHGTIQRYDRPPITDQRTGARNNPGQDFRCRCVDRPVVE